MLYGRYLLTNLTQEINLCVQQIQKCVFVLGKARSKSALFYDYKLDLCNCPLVQRESIAVWKLSMRMLLHV